ncbi:MAG: PhnD/SsuA/transferrin family substrate-binding protein [Rhizobiales bacterium]|nr:PhnD/SsuA/transferrin family substrate-binding protein [Hyphomicrobiales bacterium]
MNSTVKQDPIRAPARTQARRRQALAWLAAAPIILSGASLVRAQSPLNFGLTPVFLTNDLELLTRLETYLAQKTGREIALVQRRTYEEITGLLLSGQLTAAWICGYPFAQYRDRLSLVAVPVWQGQPLYRSYLIAGSGRNARSIDDLRGDIHAFSDPNSNSGFLVTAALLAERKLRPEQFFRQSFFTYGHRNVVRAVASGLAQSGSVDGYVWEVMASIEPELTGSTEIVSRSQLLGFPPIACLKTQEESVETRLMRDAFVGMAHDPAGREILGLLKLDGFSVEDPGLFDSIAKNMLLVRALNT